MAKSYASTVIKASPDEVWAHVRDFNGLATWHSGLVSQSEIEDGKAGDQVGAVRSFTLTDGTHLREKLLAFSDHERSYTYDFQKTPFDVDNYCATLRVTPLTVPPAGQATLLPALFKETPGRWVAVPETPKPGQQLPYLFVVKEKPYIPASRPVLTPGRDAELVLVGYNLQPGEWTAHTQVMAADGQEMPGGAFKVVDKEAGSGAGPSRLLATFQPPPALPPGDYSLRVTLTDGAGKAETSTSPFAVGGAGARGGR
jgi:hypothetical protein